MLRLAVLLICALIASPAKAGETACWFDAGVVVVPAEVAGVAGDYILDTGTSQTLLDETRAQGAGFEETTLTANVRLAGVALRNRSVAVQGLDLRTWNLPTAVAGVIGADVLRDYVVDVSFSPCRVRLSRAGHVPPFHGRRLALAWDGGAPSARVEISDGAHGLAGPFVIATGMNVPVRLADDLARVPDVTTPTQLYPEGVWLARLPQLALAGTRLDDLAAGLMKPQGGLAGALGGGALRHYRLRFDFPKNRLIVARP